MLDEVDAPLDDANVDRFCRMLDEMRNRTDTRFIVITHNPVTMSRMDRLYGVTMPERGVSPAGQRGPDPGRDAGRVIQDTPPPPAAHALALTGIGRFVVFADVATIERRDNVVRMRSLQVVEEDFTVGAMRYLGGWSWWRFECDARMADRLDFASVAVGGTEGPSTAEGQPAYPAAPGGDAAELLAVACGTMEAEIVATTVDDAVRIGRAAMAE